MMYCIVQNRQTTNLLSISRLDDKRIGSVFCDEFYIFPNQLIAGFIRFTFHKAVLSGYREGALYKLDLDLSSPSQTPTAYMTRTPKRSMFDWHLATNHLHERALKRMSTLVDGMVLSD